MIPSMMMITPITMNRILMTLVGVISVKTPNAAEITPKTSSIKRFSSLSLLMKNEITFTAP